MSKGSWLVLVLILVGLGLTVRAFWTNLSPYVTVEEAKRAGQPAHVAVEPLKETVRFDLKSMTLRFVGRDETGTMPILYPKGKPNNFEAATKVVVIGQYRDGTFHAQEMLLKCPSKYQGEKR